MTDQKKELLSLFYNKVERTKQDFDGYLDMMKATTALDHETRYKVANNYINYRKAKRFPSEQLVLAFVALFTEKELKQLLDYITNNRSRNYIEVAGSLDQQMAIQIFAKWIDDGLEKVNGSYKRLVRQTGVFSARENTNIASILRQLRNTNQLPSSHLLKRIKPCLKKSDYLILFRAISEQETTLDVNGEAGVELSKTMTDEERQLQRFLRLQQRIMLLKNCSKT